MDDIIVTPRIFWKIDLSYLNSFSRYCSKNIHILSSCWKLVIEVDAEWDDFEISLIPENPDFYKNMRFLVKCGIKDNLGICQLEILSTVNIDFLLNNYIWEGSRSLLLSENLISNNILSVLCSIEPEGSLENHEFLTDSTRAESHCAPLPCTDDLISDFSNLLNQDLHHDVIIECENKIIKAHKNILSCRSKFFEGMLRGNTKEAVEGKAVIRDTPFHILEKIIGYIYTAKIIIENISIACSIYGEADKFLIAPLKERCSAFFKAYLWTPCSKTELGSKVTDASIILGLAEYHADISLQCWMKDYLANSELLVTFEWCNFAENNREIAIEVYFNLLKKVTRTVRI